MSTPPPADGQGYRILDLLGEGGFGRVYRARFEGSGGFQKDVAVKLLLDPAPPTDVLERFRDESRILGLVRDRAVISVEPPTRLGGYWAVIMEYVPGANCRALQVHRGIFPPRVALEIVQEIARALDHMYHEPGDDGRPLELVHRDIKPGNIQITKAGEVKLLDFGVARARFDAREAITTRSIRGTFGYIAPERLHGIETPAGDTFSLGMVLFKLITGLPTDRSLIAKTRDAIRGAEGHALTLAARMCDDDAHLRPSLREVEERCSGLVQRIDGPGLRDWAEANVPHHVGNTDDVLCGQLLVETPFDDEPFEEDTTGSGRANWLLIASLTGFNLFLLLIGVIGTGVAAIIVLSVFPWRSTPTIVTEVPSLPVVEVGTAAPQGSAPPDGVVDDPEPDVADPPVQVPRPRRPRPTRTPDPAPPPPADALDCAFGSQPLGAEVFLDGVSIGRTPIIDYDVPTGPHELLMRIEDRSATLSIDVGKRKPTRFVWKGGEAWEVLY